MRKLYVRPAAGVCKSLEAAQASETQLLCDTIAVKPAGAVGGVLVMALKFR